MTNEEFNTELLNHILDDEVWENLSRDFRWTQDTLKRYEGRLDWQAVSGNDEILWTPAMLEAFQSKIDWGNLSRIAKDALLTPANLDRFAAYWDWKELSGSEYVPFTDELLLRYADRWDWAEIIDNRHVNKTVGLNRAFLDRYKDHIHLSDLQRSRLWYNILEAHEKEISTQILSEDD